MWVWCCTLLFLFIPKLYNGNFTPVIEDHDFKFIQFNTPVGAFHVSRFPFDTQLLSYLDGYDRLVEVTYVNDVIGIAHLRTTCEVKSPIGFCIVVNKILRGKYIPYEVAEQYSIPNHRNGKYGVSTDMLRILEVNELTAMCEYYRQSTLLEYTELSEEVLAELIEKDNSAIVLMHNYYPLLVYQKTGSNFYAYDPIRRSDKAYLVKNSEGDYVYKYGLLTFAGGEVVKCLDTLD